MRPHSSLLNFVAFVLVLSYGVCHLGDGSLRVMHTVSHELDAVWDYYAGNAGGHTHGHGHTHGNAHAHGGSHAHDGGGAHVSPQQHQFSGLRRRAQLSAMSHDHAHPLLTALANAQEQSDSSGTPADDQDRKAEKTKKASEKYESLTHPTWVTIETGREPRVPPADQRRPSTPFAAISNPPPEV